MDVLADALRLRREAGRSLFSPASLLVSSHLIGRSVERELAERLAGTADVRVETLHVEAERWLTGVGGPFLQEPQLRERLAVLLAYVGRRADDPGGGWSSWWAWLRGERGDPTAVAERAAGLAIRLAALFARYEWERPRMLRAWMRGEAEETGLEPQEEHDPERAEVARWQRTLWRLVHGLEGLESMLRTQGESDSSPTLGRFEPIASRAGVLVPPGEAAAAPLPPPPAEEIWVLAPPEWPELLGEVVACWARCARVHAVLLDPSEDPQWFEAVRVGGELRSQLTKSGVLHPLLARWGAHLGEVREAMLRDLAGASSTSQVDALRERVPFVAPRSGESMRDWVRSSFVRDVPGAQPRLDETFVRVAAQDPRREVEWAAERIWRWMREARARGEGLRLDRVGVLLAARERQIYHALIEQVFPRAHGGVSSSGGIPFVLVDRPLLGGSQAGQALSRLLELPLHVPTRPRWLDLLTHPCFLAAEPEADPEAWIRLLDATGALHGLDAEDHRDTHLGAWGPHFDQAQLRLALGQLVSGERIGGEGRFRWPSPRGEASFAAGPWVQEGGEAARALLGALASLVSAVRMARREERSVAAWARFAEAWARRVLKAPPGEPEEARALDRLCDELRAVGEAAGGAPVPYRLFHTLARRRLEGLQILDARAPLGGVQVGSFRRLCRLPFRHVVVLGLAEQEMPASVPSDPIDLRLPVRCEGRSLVGGALGHLQPAERDRRAFLELLLGPQRSLAFCWPAVEPHSGEPIPPSPLLTELSAWFEGMDVSWPLYRTRRRRWERGSVGEGGGEAERLGEPPEWVHEGAMAEHRAARLGERLRAEGVLLETSWMQARMAAALRREGRAAWLVGPAGQERRESPEAVEPVRDLSVARLARFVGSPVQAWAAEALGMGAMSGEPPGSREEEPFGVARWQAASVLSESLRIAASSGWDEERALACYALGVSRLQGRGQWPLGAPAEALAVRHRNWLRLWLEAARCWFPDARGRTLGLGYVQGSAGAEAPPLRVLPAVELAGGLYRVVGEAGWELHSSDASMRRVWLSLLAQEGGKSRPRREDFHRARREALRRFVGHLAACAAGDTAERELRVWLLPREEEGRQYFWEIRYVMAAVCSEEARSVLTRWARQVFEEAFPGRSPASLLLESMEGKKMPLPMSELAARASGTLPYVPEGGEHDAGGLGSDRFGPFPQWMLRQVPPLEGGLLLQQVRERLDPFLRYVVERAADASGRWFVFARRVPEAEG